MKKFNKMQNQEDCVPYDEHKPVAGELSILLKVD